MTKELISSKCSFCQSTTIKWGSSRDKLPFYTFIVHTEKFDYVLILEADWKIRGGETRSLASRFRLIWFVWMNRALYRYLLLRFTQQSVIGIKFVQCTYIYLIFLNWWMRLKLCLYLKVRKNKNSLTIYHLANHKILTLV